MSAITAPASTTSQPASIELMTMRLVEPTSCMSPCLSPINDLVTPTDALLDQANDQRIDLMDMAWEEVSLSIRR